MLKKGQFKENIAKDQLPSSSLVSLTSNGEMINELKNNQLQAVVLEKAIAEGYISQNPDLAIAGRPLKSTDTDTYAVAFAKGTDKKLIASVNKVIKKAKQSGEFDAWIEKLRLTRKVVLNQNNEVKRKLRVNTLSFSLRMVK